MSMRPASNRRPRGGRTSGGRRGNGANRSFDSNGPDVKIRGTAIQVYDKYCALARDATASGDRVMAENYLQHAEHYFRLMNANAAEAAPQGRRNPGARFKSEGESEAGEAEEAVAADAPQAAAETQGEAVEAAAEGDEAPAAAKVDAPKPRAPRGRPRKPRAPKETGEADAASSAPLIETAAD